MASTCASSATSQRMAIALWPCAASSSAAVRAAFSFQSASTTEAPDSAKALAVARPSPDAAPVTSATFPSNEMFMNISCRFAGSVHALLALRTLSFGLGVAVALDGDLRGDGIDVPDIVGCKLDRRRGDVLIKAAELGDRKSTRLNSSHRCI